MASEQDKREVDQALAVANEARIAACDLSAEGYRAVASGVGVLVETVRKVARERDRLAAEVKRITAELDVLVPRWHERFDALDTELRAARAEVERLTAERDEAREWGERFGIRRGTSIGDIVLEMDRRHQEAVECLTAELAAERERKYDAPPPAAWQRKPVTHEWAYRHAGNAVEASQRLWVLALGGEWVPGRPSRGPGLSWFIPLSRPIEPSERGDA